MKKFGLRIFSLVIALVVAVVLTGCVLQQGTKIEFTKLPTSVYTDEEGSINLNDVEIAINNGTPMSLEAAKTSYNLVVTGNSWTTYGDYTLVVVLDGVAVSFKYSVIDVTNIEQDNYDIDWEGAGTEVSPWLISSEKELKGLAAVVNGKAQNVNGVAVADKSLAGKYIKLTADIKLTLGWEPIGAGNRETVANYFAGNFDGNNHEISGLTNVGYNPAEAAGTYETSTQEIVYNGYVFGLFGNVSGATIKNIKMNNVYTEATSFVIDGEIVNYKLDSVGAIAGYIKPTSNVTTVENCHVLSGVINGYDATAGVVGRAYGALTVKDSSNAADVNCNRPTYGKCGGLVGITSGSYSFNITNNSNSGTINNEKTSLAGSIVGRVMNSSIITESGNSNTGRVFARGTEVFQFGTYNNASGDKFPSGFIFENIENWKKIN